MAVALAAATVGCSRSPEATATPSLLLVTYGYAPAACFETNATPSMTPVFDSLAAEYGRRERWVEEAPDATSAARALLSGEGESALSASFRRKHGFRTGAFVADPSLGAIAAEFDESLVPPQPPAAHLSARAFLLPRPFEHPRHEGFLRGAAVTDAALSWLAAEAGIPAESPRTPRAKHRPRSGSSEREKPVQGRLAKPVFLWVHLADPIFQDSPEHLRVGGGAASSRLAAEIAYMDLQLGRLVGFLSEHGLRDRFQIVVTGLHGDPQTAEEAADSSPQAPWRAIVGLFPPDAGFRTPDAGHPAPTAVPEPSDSAALAFRLRRPDPADTNLVADCESFAAAHPDSAEAWGWLGVARLLAKQPAEALAAQTNALARAPQNAFRMSNAGLAYLETGDVVKAIDLLENAYLAEPQNGLYKANLAAVLLRVGMAFTEQEQYGEASACLSRVLYLQPNHLYGLLAQGRLHEKMGQAEMAANAYRKALSLQPKFKPARDALDALERKP